MTRAATIDRRQFLARTGALAGAGALISVGACDRNEPVFHGSIAAPGVESWEGVRGQFALDPSYAHFAAPVLASHPAPVRDAIAHHRAELDRNTRVYMDDNEASLEKAVLDACDDYFGSSPGGVALTDSTTMGLGLVYGGIAVREGQEIVTSEHDFYATHESLRLRAERDGLSYRKIVLYDDSAAATADEIVGRIREGIRDNTRVLALTWVHSSTGVKLPAKDIASMVAEVNASRDRDDRVLLCLDSVHAFGVESETPGDIGCDFLITGCHKWLFGPRGTGVVWASENGWDAAQPIIPTFDINSYIAWIEGHPPVGLEPGAAMTPGGYHSFEHRWALADALRLHLEIGKDKIAAHTHGLATRLKQGIAEIDGITLETPMSEDLSAGIVCCEVAGTDPMEVVDRLENDHHIVASVTPYRERFVRFLPSITTSPDEVDALLEALKTFA